MKCSNCQSEQNSDSKYCTNCGAELTTKLNNNIQEDNDLEANETSKKEFQTKPLNNFKGIIIGIAIAILAFMVYENWDSVGQIFQSKAKRNVDKFLTLMKIENPSENELKDIVKIISPEYIGLISKNSYYKIENWKIDKTENDEFNPSYTKVFVLGSAKNAFGAELKRNPIFVLDGKDQIIDSYNFIANQKYSDLNKSDMEIYNLVNSLREKVKIENWSWHSDYSSYSPGRVEGKATIFNGSEVPVSFVKLEITYYDKYGNVVNTDETYAVGGDDLLPGQRRVIDWSTYNCEGAKKASVKLNFN